MVQVNAIKTHLLLTTSSCVRRSLAFPDIFLKVLLGKDTLPLTMFSFVRSWESTRNGELPVRLWGGGVCEWVAMCVCVWGEVRVCRGGTCDPVWVWVELTGCKGQLLATTYLFPLRLAGPTRPLELQKDNIDNNLYKQVYTLRHKTQKHQQCKRFISE